MSPPISLPRRPRLAAVAAVLLPACAESTRPNESPDPAPAHAPVAITARTRVTVNGPRFLVNGKLTYGGQPAEGLLPNVRMVNSVFEDVARRDFDPERNTSEFIGRMEEYVRHGVLGFTVSLQGGYPGYEGARNSAFRSDGSLNGTYLSRVARVIERADALGAVVILSLFYQRQDQVLRDEQAVRTGVVKAVGWIAQKGYRNVILEIVNEYGHSGFKHAVLRSDGGVAGLIRLAQDRHSSLLVGASTLGKARTSPRVAAASDVILIHTNTLATGDIPARIKAVRNENPGKPVVVNEDSRIGSAAVTALTASVGAGASYGLMVERINQHYPFDFYGRSDDPKVYDRYRALAY